MRCPRQVRQRTDHVHAIFIGGDTSRRQSEEQPMLDDTGCSFDARIQLCQVGTRLSKRQVRIRLLLSVR